MHSSAVFICLGLLPHHAGSQVSMPNLDIKRLVNQAAYHIYSIWLFTSSDIKTIILPSLLFSLFTAASPLAAPTVSFYDLAGAVPRVLFWLWINLLPFNIDNQRQQDSVDEDRLNKAWRTLPSGRMEPAQAGLIMMCAYPLALLTSLQLGGTDQCLSLMALGFCYNSLRGGDVSCLVRNLINAAGFNRFTTGALSVLLRRVDTLADATCTRDLLLWQLIIAGIVFSTIQTQDMYDQRGDAERGRATVPLVIGDSLARWTIALPMVAWSIFCPVYLGNSGIGLLASGGLGCLVAVRSLLLRSVSADRTTFLLWNIWLVSIYLLPLFKKP